MNFQTHKFALGMIGSGVNVTLKDALAATYLQGIYDAVGIRKG